MQTLAAPCAGCRPTCRPRPIYLGQITYWDAYDCQAIRVVEGSGSATVGALVTSPDGEALVSGGADRLVKLRG
jgi:hypothetical protein